MARLTEGSYQASVALTLYYLVRGEADAAVEWAGKWAGERDPFVIYVIRLFEKLLRQSPGWPALLKKLNLAEVS